MRFPSSSNQFSHAFARACVALVAFSSLSACTLKPRDERSVRVVLPEIRAAARAQARFGASAVNALSVPTAIGDFACFGIQVTGPGIGPDPRLGCAPTDPEPHGILAGLVPSTGGEIELMVPAGARRQVQVFGVVGSAGCPTMEALMALPPSTRFASVGKPYPLGTSVVDLFEDAVISISASFSAATNPIFATCAATSARNLASDGVGGGMDFGGITEATPSACNSGVGRPCLSARTGFAAFTISGGLTVPLGGPPRYDLRFGHFFTEP